MEAMSNDIQPGPSPDTRSSRRQFVGRSLAFLGAMPLFGSALSACASDTAAAPSTTTRSINMKTFVLIHGAWSNANVWSAVAQRLTADGHTVLTPDLPAHGADATLPEKATLQGYADAVTAAAKSAGQPVVLVGHSMAGKVISTVAEQNPELVAHLVYLAAFLLPSGQSLYGFTQTSPGMADSALGPALRPGEGVLGVDPASFINVFCADAPAELAKQAAADLKPDPLGPLGTPITVTSERWGRVPRSYVYTSQDRCVSPASQREMVKAVGVGRTATIDASHLAMLSKPDELASIISSLIQ
jgi:pimeloyl-ACP methyl ester carboxylesterase